MTEVRQIGNIMPTATRNNPNQGRVYDTNGLSPAITNVSGGGGREPMIIDDKAILTPKRTEYGKAIHKDYESGNIKESRHNMTQLEPREDGITNTLTTVLKDNLLLEKDGLNPMPDGTCRTLKSQYVKTSAANFDKGTTFGASGVVETVPIKQATKQGYIECEVGGVADFSYPDSKSRRGRVESGGQISPTLMAAGSDICKVESRYRIRKLTPKSCWRLMDFKDEDFEKAEKVVSNSQLYKQAGNSLIVVVFAAILSQLHIQEIKPWNERTIEEREELLANRK
jgi:DNA (cytosine-5)-methyltransferase 1